MATISFQTTIDDRSNAVALPEEYRGKFSAPVTVTITGVNTPNPFLRRRRGVKKISPPEIDTTGWHFDREDANAR